MVESVLLENSLYRAEIYLFGGLLNRFEIQQPNGNWFNAIMGFDNPNDARTNLIHGFKSAKLSPFACRLNRGQFTFQGQSYQNCAKHELNGHSIHGLMYDAEFELLEKTPTSVILGAEYRHELSGFPFDYSLKIKYLLSENGLTIETQIQNIGNQAFPLADGWHPYFTLGGSVDNWKLKINSNQQLEFNQDLLPTGNKLLDERFFQGACELKNIVLDNSFILNETDLNDMDCACILSNENNHLQLKLFPDQSYPFLQIYIPPERQSIALENLSGAPDAFNNGLGLLTLEAGQIQTFSTRYQLENI